MTATPLTAQGQLRAVLAGEPPELWYRDPVSCLQSTLAAALRRAGHDPLEVLGAHWEFRFLPGDVRPEEFYYPCAVTGDLAGSLAPHHPVSSRWHYPPDPGRSGPEQSLRGIAAAITFGQLVIAAVDNFYLPFRPAFGDVHAAHLIAVYGIDLAADQVLVSDAMPPAFAGPITVADFLRAWSSANPPDPQDVFFSDTRIGRRFMTVTAGEPFPRLDAPMLRRILAANLAGFSGEDASDQAGWTGLPGLKLYLMSLLDACARPDPAQLASAYPLGWGMQAQASLHAELLRRWGTQAGLPELREAARLVETAAHAWTGLRMTAAHGRGDPRACAGELARHAAGLRRSYELALAGLQDAIGAL